jgi:hypothetical protein
METGKCKHCRRRIYLGTFLGEPCWRLVHIEYARHWLCDARGMEDEHEPEESK